MYVGESLCGEVKYEVGKVAYEVQCGNAVGHTIKVVQNDNFLTLCEVEAFCSPTSSKFNIFVETISSICVSVATHESIFCRMIVMAEKFFTFAFGHNNCYRIDITIRCHQMWVHIMIQGGPKKSQCRQFLIKKFQRS